MIKISAQNILLYTTGIVLLVFGQRNFWEEIQQANRQKKEEKEIAEEAHIASDKKFEVQNLSFDPITKTWKNQYDYFQTVHVGQVNFKALKSSQRTSIESNDDENASDSF